jgi:hypothetical protein
MRTKVTKEDVQAKIAGVEYFIMPDGRTTIAHVVLRNGFTVRGESACVSAANFNKELGEQYALEKAFDKIWELEGYLLAEQLNAYDNIDRIARVCHEVNKAYCEALGDSSQPTWEDAPEWQRSSARMGVDLHSMGNFGPEASHISWMKQKVDEGWVYGPVKDPEAKQHPCIVPFDQLPREQQAKDYIFRAVVHSLKGA